jgi:hypothetical protein
MNLPVPTPPVRLQFALLSLLDGTGVAPWKPGVRYRKTRHLRHGGGGSRSVILAGIFYFGNRRKNPLLTALPPVLVIHGGTDRNTAWLKVTLNAIAEELAEEQPGSNLVIAKLADLLFMQCVRIWLRTIAIPSAGCVALWTLLCGVPSLACTLRRNVAGRCKRLPKRSAVREPFSRSGSALWSARELLVI